MKRILLFTLLLIPIFCLAQSNYYRGSVILNDDVTLSGYINYRVWAQNPKSIEFKETQDNKSTKSFSPSDIKSFTIDGHEKYITFAGRISLNDTQFPNLSIGIDTTTRYGIVFLRQIVNGKSITLYSYVDGFRKRFFIQEKQATPIELSYQEYYDETKTKTLTSSRFKGQLFNLVDVYAADNTKLHKHIEGAQYTTSDLQGVVNELNGLDAKTQDNKQPGTGFFAGASLSAATTSFHGGDINLATAGSSASLSPKFSAGLDIFTNPNIKKFIIRAELDFSYLSAKFTSSEPSATPSQPFVTTYSFKQYNIAFAPQIIWNIYTKEAFKFYIDAGVGVNYSFYTNNNLYLTGPVTSGSLKPYDLESVWFNFPLQSGVVLNNHLELFVLYTIPKPYYKYGNASLDSQLYGAGVHFLFGK